MVSSVHPDESGLICRLIWIYTETVSVSRLQDWYDYTLKEGNSEKMFCSPLERKFTVKGEFLC